jgi:ribosomal protein S18 acetylase RimI-like enzyme
MRFWWLRYLRNVLGIPLTLVMALVLGFLSFAGILLVLQTAPFALPLAIAAFFMSSVIEAKIYGENIFHSFYKMFSPRFRRYSVAKDLLNEKIEQLEAEAKPLPPILEQYKRLKAYVDGTAANATFAARWFMEPNDRAKRREAAKHLRRMERYFQQYLFASADERDTLQKESGFDFSDIFPDDEITALQADFNKKNKITNISLIFIFIASISCGLVSMSVIQGDIAKLLASKLLAGALAHLPFLTVFAAFGPGLYVIGALACAAFFFYIFNTIYDMVFDESLQNLVKTIKDKIWDKPSVGSVCFGLLAVVLLSLAVFVAIFTGVTWWRAAAPVIKMIPSLSKAATIAAIGSVFFYSFASLLFTLENTSETLESFEDFSLRDTLKRVGTWVKSANPIRLFLNILYVPFYIVTFGGHLASMGAATDNFVNRAGTIAAMAGSAVNEGTEDAHYFVSKGKYSGDNSFDVMRFGFKVALSPLFVLAGVWDYVKFRGTDKHRSLLRAVAESFEVKTSIEPALKPKNTGISNEWKRVELIQKITNKQKRYQKAGLFREEGTSEKRSYFDNLRAAVVARPAVKESDVLSVTIKATRYCITDVGNYGKVDTHRNQLFSTSRPAQTHARQFVEKLQTEFGALPLSQQTAPAV